MPSRKFDVRMRPIDRENIAAIQAALANRHFTMSASAVVRHCLAEMASAMRVVAPTTPTEEAA